MTKKQFNAYLLAKRDQSKGLIQTNGSPEYAFIDRILFYLNNFSSDDLERRYWG